MRRYSGDQDNTKAQAAPVRRDEEIMKHWSAPVREVAVTLKGLQAMAGKYKWRELENHVRKRIWRWPSVFIGSARSATRDWVAHGAGEIHAVSNGASMA